MADRQDYYKMLGVAETAGADDIKKAYRKLAKKYHPDVTGGDKAKAERFKEVTAAYETLGDEKKRAAYDEIRRNPYAGGFSGQPGAGSPFASGGNVDLGDLFSQFGRGGGTRVNVNGDFGGANLGDLFSMFGAGGAGPSRRAPQRGEDVVARLEIDLPEAALGAEKEIAVDGRRLTVKIPAGVTDGSTIRLAGQGHPGSRGAPAGDLLIELAERPHALFHRRDSSGDIEVEVPVSIETAVLGGKAEVPTLEGPSVTLKVPPSTSSGKRLRLRGKGAHHGKDRGALYAVISIQVPDEVPERARELIAEFAKLTK